MNFYGFGDKNNPTIFLIHGTASHWKLSFGQVINGLSDEYHVVCVALDGHDERDNTEMISIMNEVEKIESHIQKIYASSIYAIYGSSLGGSIVAKLLERGNIDIYNAITGSTDFDFSTGLKAIILSKAITRILYNNFISGEIKGVFKLFVTSEEKKKYLKILDKVIYKDITYETLYKEYYTDLIMPIRENILLEKTKIYCVFGTEEDSNKLINRYKTYLPTAKIIGLSGLNHEELLFRHPEEWVNMIKSLLNTGYYKYNSDSM
ncbi:alpha/beta hydrolase [Clostridium sp. SHJSY1]|nr:alpha/beta hydrolase [Clostridium sp. SHJSY1]